MVYIFIFIIIKDLQQKFMINIKVVSFEPIVLSLMIVVRCIINALEKSFLLYDFTYNKHLINIFLFHILSNLYLCLLNVIYT